MGVWVVAPFQQALWWGSVPRNGLAFKFGRRSMPCRTASAPYNEGYLGGHSLVGALHGTA